MIADALAYAAIRWADLFRAPTLAAPTPGGVSPTSVWDGLAPLAALPPGGSLRVCEQLCGDARLQRAALPEGLELRVPEICGLALRLYFHEPALTTLHAVTSAQALAELTDDPDLWARYWVWLTALYVEKGRPAALPGTVGPDAAAVDWPELAARARTTGEVHLIKMAYSCRWLEQRFGPEPLYRLAVGNMLKAQNA